MRHVDSKSSDLLETTFVSYSCFYFFFGGMKEEWKKKNCSVQIDQFVGGCQGNGKAKKKEQKKIS